MPRDYLAPIPLIVIQRSCSLAACLFVETSAFESSTHDGEYASPKEDFLPGVSIASEAAVVKSSVDDSADGDNANF